MKTIQLLLYCFVVLGLYGQQSPNKGVSPIATTPGIRSGPSAAKNTYAVVVGISDYGDERIPDLRYADRDAAAFANWLRAPDGLALPDTCIRLLVNRQATTAQMIVNLDWLIETSKAGDRVFIYFSGHGDVERVTKFNLGYLLSYDSPPAVYGAGAFSLQYLQAILSTLSENNVQVFMITDACRAGKLSGNSINGTQVTAKQLSQQFANEIKILSCQPDEFSLEGEQWGGGRGCFSYHLEDALYGFADADHNQTVDLLELRRYLEDRVQSEAEPQSQLPMVSGPMKTAVSSVREAQVAARRATKGGQLIAFKTIETKGMEARLLATVDTSVQQLYAQFSMAIDSGHLMSPAGKSANDYFKILIEKPEMAALSGAMKRRLAAALMDEGQMVIGKVMKSDLNELEKCWTNQRKFDHLPIYFNRAAEILGERHYAFRNLKAKALYFQFLASEKGFRSDSRIHLHEALSFDSSLAIIYFALGHSYFEGDPVALGYYQRAQELAPHWLSALNWLGYTYLYSEPKKGVFYHNKALTIDSNNCEALIMLGWAYQAMGQPDSALLLMKRAAEALDQKYKSQPNSFTATDCIHASQALRELKAFEKAKDYLLLGEKISKGKYGPIYGNLCLVYTDLMDFENAVKACNTLFEVNGLKKRDWGGNPGHIFFNYLYNNDAAVRHYDETQKVETNQVQAWFSIDRRRCLVAAKRAMLDSISSDFCLLAFYAGECASALGMSDSAAQFFKLITEKAEIVLNRNDVSMPDYLFAALAYERLGMQKDLQQLIKKAKEVLKDDAWLHFNLARIYANTGLLEAATESLNEAISLGWQPNSLVDIHGTLSDLLLNPIRETDAFKALVRKHFPKYYDIATRIPGKK